MRIRAITVGTNVDRNRGSVRLPHELPDFLASAKIRFAEAGFEIQTTRLMAPAFTTQTPAETTAVVEFARAFEAAAQAAGFGYSSIGPVAAEALDYVEPMVAALLATQTIFATLVIGDRRQGVSLPAISAAADVIQRLAQETDNGFGNLRFAALANCPPNIPFFPAGYHDGGPPSFGIAWEAADLAVDAFLAAGSLDEARRRLGALIEREGGHLAAIAELLAEQHELRFAGIDLSLAPFPEQTRSIGEAFERLGLDAFGAPGTLYVASLVTEILQSVELPRVGYSGLMLPVLEDPILGRRAAEGAYTINDLLLYSAVCGLGLDVVPLPGQVSREELRGILLDVATLAVRLDKPLTARLMPIPGRRAGEPTGFDFDYFVNTVALPIKGLGAARLFARAGL